MYEISNVGYFSASRRKMPMVIRTTNATRKYFNKRDCNRSSTGSYKFCVKEIIRLCTLCNIIIYGMSVVYSVQSKAD